MLSLLGCHFTFLVGGCAVGFFFFSVKKQTKKKVEKHCHREMAVNSDSRQE